MKISKRSLILFVLLLVLFCTSCGNKEQPVNLQEGLSVLEQMEQRDVASVQQTVSEAQTVAGSDAVEQNLTVSSENQELTDEEILSLNYRDIFSGCALLGDSITSEIVEYGYLDSDNVFCKTGISMVSADEYIEKAKGLNPKIVFLNFGSNDIDMYQYNEDKFREACKTLYDKVQAAMPDAQIYVNSIFPVTQKVIEKDPWREETARYNEIMKEVCEEYGIPFLDHTYLATEERYAPDGMHFQPGMYPHWLYSMAKGAGLL